MVDYVQVRDTSSSWFEDGGFWREDYIIDLMI